MALTGGEALQPTFAFSLMHGENLCFCGLVLLSIDPASIFVRASPFCIVLTIMRMERAPYRSSQTCLDHVTIMATLGTHPHFLYPWLYVTKVLGGKSPGVYFSLAWRSLGTADPMSKPVYLPPMTLRASRSTL